MPIARVFTPEATLTQYKIRWLTPFTPLMTNRPCPRYSAFYQSLVVSDFGISWSLLPAPMNLWLREEILRSWSALLLEIEILYVVHNQTIQRTYATDGMRTTTNLEVITYS